MKATINGQVIAEAASSTIVSIEGNSYFPPDSLVQDALTLSTTQYTCPWKGKAQYWNVVTTDGSAADGAWSYPAPKPSATERVGQGFAGFVAFDTNQVDLSA